MPRRKAAANEEMDDTNEQQPPVAKRAKAANKHAAIVLAIDVGSNSAICSNFMERDTDLQRSLQIADWIISRKLFTESKDQFSILFFGHESTTNQNYPNVYVHNPEFDKARVEWLQMFRNEVQVNPKCPGDYLAALYTALDIMRFHAEDLDKGELEESTVILISNFSGLDEGDQVMEALNPVASAFRTLGTSLITIGTDLTEEPKSKAQKIGHHFIRQLFDKANQIDGSAYNFQEGLSKLKFFVPKPKPPRGQPFNLELGKDFSIRVQMYLKNSTEVAIKLKFDPVSGSSTGNATNGGGQHPQQLKQVRRYETIADEGKAITFADIDQAPDVAFSNQSTGIPTGKIVEKANIVKGYRYGKSLIPFDKDVQKMVEIPEKCKQLQLLQFTSRDNILPQFLMSNTRYILPHKDAKSYDKTAHNTFSALVMAMLEMNVVALCRYSYNVNSNPKLVCLMPKMTKAENYPVLIHYELPFRDDFRYFNFPPMSQDSDFQEEAYIDNYIDTLMLSAEDGSTEMLKKKDVHDPRTQYQCMTLREKALNPEKTIELTPEDKATLLEMLSPPKKLIKKASEAVQQAKDIFKLELNAKTRMALFKKPKAPSVLVGVDDSLQPILASLDELKPLNGNDVEEGDDKKAKKENARKESME